MKPIQLQVSEKDYLAAVRELYFWRKGTSGGFMTRLFDMMLISDPHNFSRLRLGFPAEALALECWRNSGGEEDFFSSHGVYFFQPIKEKCI